MTTTQANLLIVEVGIVAAAAVVTLGGAMRSLWKVRKTAEDVKDVAAEAVSRVL
jgi:hypothetical protein